MLCWTDKLVDWFYIIVIFYFDISSSDNNNIMTMLISWSDIADIVVDICSYTTPFN